MFYKRFRMVLPLVVMLSLLLSACGGENPTAAPAAATTAPTTAAAANTPAAAAATDTPAAAAAGATNTSAPGATATEAMAGTTPTTAAGGSASGPAASWDTMDWSQIGPEIANAMKGQYKGTTVSLSHGLSGDEEAKFTATFKQFQQKTGINVKLVPGGSVESWQVKSAAGTIEDIVNFPQPGTMAGYAAQGKLTDLNKVINPDWLKKNYKSGFVTTGMVKDASGNQILGGVFERVNVKGTVWYPKKQFDAAGYKVPTTWDEQQKLLDQIVADGDTPWCFGIGSGASPGWPATDIIEQLMLRTTSLDNYDKWTTGALPFTDPIVKNAFDVFTKTWLDPKYVFGGPKNVATTQFGDAGTPMFQNPAKCWLLDQGNFITTFFEKNTPGVKAGVDYDFYPLPPIDPQYGAPIEFGGDLFSIFHDRPEVRAVVQFFTTYLAIQPWIQAGGGGALSPHNDANLADYTTDIDRKVAQTLSQAPNVRFDGSDLMPAEAGSGSFPKGITDYVSGAANLDQALTTMQNGWKNVKK
jgi:alpha-glucoside transport system substrate-binding protein